MGKPRCQRDPCFIPHHTGELQGCRPSVVITHRTHLPSLYSCRHTHQGTSHQKHICVNTCPQRSPMCVNILPNISPIHTKYLCIYICIYMNSNGFVYMINTFGWFRNISQAVFSLLYSWLQRSLTLGTRKNGRETTVEKE